MSTRCFIGLDLGQGADPTALAVLQRPSPYVAGTPRPTYGLRHLKRFPSGAPYAEVVETLIGLLHAPEVPGAAVGIDQTGVGRVTCKVFAVTLTNGAEATTGELGG